MTSVKQVNDEVRFTNWLNKYSEQQVFTILSSARTINWTRELLENYRDYWDWEEISKNTGIKWDVDLIINFENELFWDNDAAFLQDEAILNDISIASLYLYHNSHAAFKNEKLQLTELLIRKNLESISWRTLSKTDFFEKHPHLIEPFLYQIEFSHIKWPFDEIETVELLERHKAYLDWIKLAASPSLPWSQALIEKFAEYVDYYELLYNPNLPWVGTSLFEFLLDKIDLNQLKKYRLKAILTPEQLEMLIFKQTQRMGEMLLNSYEGIWSPLALIYKDFKIDTNEDNQFNRMVQFEALSALKLTEWPESLIQKYADLWNWSELATNPSVQWTDVMCEKFADRIYFRALFEVIDTLPQLNVDKLKLLYLNTCISLAKEIEYDLFYWDKALIEQFEDYIDWKTFSKTGLFGNQEIRAFDKQWYWDNLSANFNLKIDQPTFLKYRPKFSGEILLNAHIEFVEKDYLYFIDKLHENIGEYKQVAIESYTSYKERCLIIPNIPWSHKLFKAIRWHLDPEYLFANNHIPWDMQYLELIPEETNLQGCHFSNIDLSFIDEDYFSSNPCYDSL